MSYDADEPLDLSKPTVKLEPLIKIETEDSSDISSSPYTSERHPITDNFWQYTGTPTIQHPCSRVPPIPNFIQSNSFLNPPLHEAAYQDGFDSRTSEEYDSNLSRINETYRPVEDPHLLMNPLITSTYIAPLSPIPYVSPTLAKNSRPFKAMARVLTSPQAIKGPYEDGRFERFRELMLQQIRERNGGTLSVSNPRMRRSVRACGADAEYLERRRRNNSAAKRSRDLRRRNEDELAIRAAFLEAENQRLEAELNRIIA